MSIKILVTTSLKTVAASQVQVMNYVIYVLKVFCLNWKDRLWSMQSISDFSFYF